MLFNSIHLCFNFFSIFMFDICNPSSVTSALCSSTSPPHVSEHHCIVVNPTQWVEPRQPNLIDPSLNYFISNECAHHIWQRGLHNVQRFTHSCTPSTTTTFLDIWSNILLPPHIASIDDTPPYCLLLLSCGWKRHLGIALPSFEGISCAGDFPIPDDTSRTDPMMHLIHRNRPPTVSTPPNIVAMHQREHRGALRGESKRSYWHHSTIPRGDDSDNRRRRNDGCRSNSCCTTNARPMQLKRYETLRHDMERDFVSFGGQRAWSGGDRNGR